MIPAKFDYVAPTSVEDALAAIAEAGDDIEIMGVARASSRCSGCG